MVTINYYSPGNIYNFVNPWYQEDNKNDAYLQNH